MCEFVCVSAAPRLSPLQGAWIRFKSSTLLLLCPPATYRMLAWWRSDPNRIWEKQCRSKRELPAEIARFRSSNDTVETRNYTCGPISSDCSFLANYFMSISVFFLARWCCQVIGFRHCSIASIRADTGDPAGTCRASAPLRYSAFLQPTHAASGQWQPLMAGITLLTFLTDLRVGTAVNAADGISPTFMFTSLLFLLTVKAEYFSATFSVSLTYFVACFTSVLQSTTESVISSRWYWCR